MHFSVCKSVALTSAVSFAVAGCAIPPGLVSVPPAAPRLSEVTPAQRDLVYLPAPAQPIPVAVYGFSDQTGQLRPSETVQSLSRAVTQGGTSVLIKALRDAGNGNWFTVVERERLDNVLKEREIIRQMRNRYLGETETPANVLPSLLFAGLLLEGGIIGYDSNLQSGGLGARFLGIGGSVQYKQSTVTVYLRAVSVKTGEVLANVVTSKTVASVAISGDVFKFVTFDKLLEGEAGVTANEPTQIAVQSAIEKAVYALIMEGAQPGPKRLWSFADANAGSALLARYADEKARAVASVYWKDGGPSGGAAAPANSTGRRGKRSRSTSSAPTTGARSTDAPNVPGGRPSSSAAEAQPATVTSTQSR
jgi:curli production assembly/transport component CsgG